MEQNKLNLYYLFTTVEDNIISISHITSYFYIFILSFSLTYLLGYTFLKYSQSSFIVMTQTKI